MQVHQNLVRLDELDYDVGRLRGSIDRNLAQRGKGFGKGGKGLGAHRSQFSRSRSRSRLYIQLFAN